MNPSINIGLGKCGCQIIKGLKAFFDRFYPKYLDNLRFYLGTFDNDQLDFRAYFNSNTDLLNGSSEFGLEEQLKNAYKELKNLDKLGNTNTDIQSLYLNLIFGVSESGEVDLITSLISKVKTFINEGIFKHCQLRCYFILDDETVSLSENYSDKAKVQLENLLNVKIDVPEFINLYLLDDMNVDAISLGEDMSYVPFALGEFLITLSEHEYELGGVVGDMSDKFQSFGFGMVLFDQNYFQTQMRSKIISRTLEKESKHSSIESINNIISESEIINILDTAYNQNISENDIEKIRKRFAMISKDGITKYFVAQVLNFQNKREH